jgi:type III pantothenate kinase
VKSVFGGINKMLKQNTLLVDAGNSAVKWGLIDHDATDKLLATSRQQYPEKIDAAFFIQCWQTLDKPEKVFVSCVANKDVWSVLEQACQQQWNIQPERVASITDGFGLVNAYKQPAELGSDRWCAMIGAVDKRDSAFMLVDCGSAITVDVVASRGKHLGGYILPGLTMMKQSLRADTADVKVDINITALNLTPANTTKGCVDAAVYMAAVKMIEAVFEQQQKQDKSVQCLLTGGDAPLVAELLSIKHVMMPDLVLHGLAIISANRFRK